MSRMKKKRVADKEHEDVVTKEELLKNQQLHLVYLEQLSTVLPRFHGVSAVQGLTYELIQVLNNIYLSEVLS